MTDADTTSMQLRAAERERDRLAAYATDLDRRIGCALRILDQNPPHSIRPGNAGALWTSLRLALDPTRDSGPGEAA